MSYILDALRKSDQQRQHAKAPTLLTTHTVPAEPPPRRLGLQAALAVVLIGAGMLIGWLRPWQSPTVATPAEVTNQPLHRESNETQLPTHKSAMPAKESDNDSAPQPPVRGSAPLPGSIGTPVDTLAKTHGNAAGELNLTDPPPAQATYPTPTPTSPASANKPVNLADLPADLRREIPDMLIAFHQYAEAPEQRRVMINNLLLRPGDFIAPGLKLEQITPEGVEVSYHGRRFRRGVR